MIATVFSSVFRECEGRCRLRKCVSIHAPAWGATRFGFLDCRGDGVSIHAPAWGATSCWMIRLRMKWSFNPRPRMGGDAVPDTYFAQHMSFNPRPRMRGDLPSLSLVSIEGVFQSTPPHGGRHLTYKHPLDFYLFQSTPPHGGRQFLYNKLICRVGEASIRESSIGRIIAVIKE